MENGKTTTLGLAGGKDAPEAKKDAGLVGLTGNAEQLHKDVYDFINARTESPAVAAMVLRSVASSIESVTTFKMIRTMSAFERLLGF